MTEITRVSPAPVPDDETRVIVAMTTSAPPAQVWDVLVERTPEWWGEDYLGPAVGAMVIEPHLGGRVHTGGDADAGDMHGTIRHFDRPHRLEIGGVLVPGAYAGTIAISITKSKLGSEIVVEHTARGRIEAAVEERISHGWTRMASTLAELAEE